MFCPKNNVIIDFCVAHIIRVWFDEFTNFEVVVGPFGLIFLVFEMQFHIRIAYGILRITYGVMIVTSFGLFLCYVNKISKIEPFRLS